MQISEQTRWLVTIVITVILAVIGIGATATVGWKSANKIAEALNSAFRHTESSLEQGFSQTEQNTVILALGAKGDRPNWPNFLRKAKEEAIDRGLVKVEAVGFITTEAGEKRLSGYIQEQIQEIVKANQEVPFEEIAAIVIERLGIRYLNQLAKAGKTSLNEMIAIVSGFAERIRGKE